MSEKLSENKRKYSLFDSFSVRGAGTSIRVVKNAVSKTFGALSEKFVFTSARSYGAMGLAFGLLSLFLYFGNNYFLNVDETNIASLIIGISFVAVSVPLLFFDKPICIFFQDFFITDFLLFEFFSIKRMDKSDAVPGFSVLTSVVMGFVPALLGLFIPPLYVFLLLALIVFVSISIVTPEFPIIFALLVAPYLSLIADTGAILASLSMLAFVSFAFKVAIGKRSYHFEIYDALFLILSVFFLVGGIVNQDTSNALVMIALTLAYVPVSNIIVNRRLADCAVNAFIVSSVPISVGALIGYIISLFKNTDFSAKSIFISTDSYAAFLFLALAFSFCFAKEKKNRVKKAAYYAITSIHIVNIIFAWHIGLWFSTLISVFAYLIIRSKNQRKELLLVLIAFPYLLFLLPESFFAKLSEFLMISPTLNETLASFKTAFSIFSENAIFGVGFGTQTPNANMALSVAVNFGAVVLGILVAVFVLRLVQLSEYGIYMRSSLLSLITKAAAFAVFGLFSVGMTADVFSDITVYFLFVSIFGILSASLRISKTEYLDRLSYYGDQRSADSSDINVRIS
ncbi:MAG: hypothetical protein IJW38_05155 [Clostridia bacterium]|nr:hypothetical protein [Clostridia bacterium]